MKLRLKFIDNNNRAKYYTLDLENGKEKYGQLRAAIATIMGTDLQLAGVPFYLSLNYGKDVFRADENANLKDLGLVSGDVITVILEKDIPRMKPRCPATEENASVPPASVPIVCRNEPRIRNIYEVALCRESTSEAIPPTLDSSYKAEHISCTQDAVILAVNAMMEEAGFTQAYSEIGPPPLIPKWKSGDEVYKLEYCLRICPSTRCQLVCVRFPNRQLFINGIILNGPSQYSVVTLKLTCDNYVDCRRLICKSCQNEDVEPRNVYRNLPELSQIFKDGIAGPLQKIIMTDAGMPANYDLLTLPTEVKLIILKYLSFRDLLRLSEVCSNLQQISNEDSLWKKLVNRDFQKESTLENFKARKNPDETWKSVYIALHKAVEKKKKEWHRAGSCPFSYSSSYVGIPLHIPPYPIIMPEFGYPPIALDGRRNMYNPNRHFLPVRRSWDTHSIVNFNYGYFPRLV